MFIRSIAACFACMVLLLASCAGSGQTQSVDAGSENLPGSLLPSFPTDRTPAEIVDSQIKGSEYDSKSSGPVSSTNALSFNVPADGYEYAIYAFHAGDDSLLKLSLDISLISGRAPWVGLADFSSMRWEFGDQLSTGSEEFDLSGGQYKSTAGNFFFAVVGWNLSEFVVNGATVQVDSPRFSISGVVFDPLDAVSPEDVTMFLSPLGTEVLTDVDGNYSFSGLAPGSYTVTPEKAGHGFTPTSIDVEITNADITDQNFMIEDLGLPQYSVSGNIQLDGGGGFEGVTVDLSPGGGSAVTDVNGDYSIPGVFNGNYTITPSLAGYEFSPTELNITVADADSIGNDFTGSEIVAQTYSISGAISVGTSFLQNVTITVEPGSHVTSTDVNGLYSVADLAPGNYTVTPSKTGFLFTPPSASVEIVASDLTDVDFDAYPDNSGTFTVSGIVNGPPGGLSGATITLTPQSGPPINGISGPGGGYSIPDVPSGIYTATCSKSGWLITPSSQQVVVVDQNVSGVNWFASPPL